MSTATAVATTWNLDTTHTEVQFKVKHLVIATVTGFFKKFSGSVESETEDFDRDAHLKSADFFAAEQYPSLDFSGILKKVSGNDYKLDGVLTIRGTTKAVVLDVEFGGIMVDPYGNTKAGFEINGKINRKDFGLNWNAITEAGGMVVSEDVKIHINAELAKA
jgi:polyisoprenoid-binding protein YceI